MTISVKQWVERLTKSGVMTGAEIAAFQKALATPPHDGEAFAEALIKARKLTRFQAERISEGNFDNLVLGDYLILDTIGAGGMGQVFLAEHRRMGRQVALKTLPEAVAKDEQVIQRFEREVRAAARLSHPNIVTAYDAGEARGVHYFVMERVAGIDLSQLVKKSGPLSVERAVDFVVQAAQGLAYAHEAGIVHRDIKPANMLLDKTGTVKILDMGLARIEKQNEEVSATGLTSSGMVMGTIDYMAPEQALDAKQADARSDIYSLGCVMYYLLTARSVYEEDTNLKKILAHRDAPIPSLAEIRLEIPASVDNVFRQMVEKQPAARLQTMQAVITELEACGVVAVVGSGSGESAPDDPQLRQFLDGLDQPDTPRIGPSEETIQRTPEPATLASGVLAETFFAGIEEHHKPSRNRSTRGKNLWLIGGSILALVLLVGIAIKFSGSDETETTAEPQAQKTTPATESSTESPDTQPQPFAEPQDELYANDRLIAEWVLAHQGGVKLQLDNKQSLEVRELAQLPKSRFALHDIDLYLCNPDWNTTPDAPGLPNLEGAALQQTKPNRSILAWLAECPSLGFLQLYDHQPPTSALEVFSHHRGLCQIELLSSQIDDRFEFLNSVPSIRAITLWDTVQPADLENLQTVPTLKWLYLPGTVSLDPALVQRLQGANPHLLILTGESDAKQVIGTNIRIPQIERLVDQDVILKGELFDGEPWSQLVPRETWHQANFTSLELPENSLWSKANFGDVLQLISTAQPDIIALGCVNADQLVADLDQSHLPVKELHIADSDLTDAALEVLANWTQLRHIDIAGTQVSETAITEFQQQNPACTVISDFGKHVGEHRLPPGW